MSKPIALIIGAGKRVGASTAQALSGKGYRIAQVARSVKASDSNDNTLYLPADLTAADSVTSVFARLRESWGEPSVVIYNASATKFTDKSEPMSVSTEDFVSDLTINVTSAYVAAKEAVASFKTLPDDAAKVFTYTGNICNEMPIAVMMDSGVGKSGAAHMIETASKAYADRGMKFYYVDERTPEGAAVYAKVDGPAHGEFHAALVDGTANAPWRATFVKGQGYKKFPLFNASP